MACGAALLAAALWLAAPATCRAAAAPDDGRYYLELRGAEDVAIPPTATGGRPAAAIDGTGLAATLKVGGKTLKWDPGKGRMACE